jgi:hypothetical protein
VKVLDFGIAKAANASKHTETGVLKGKVAYMAPEQASGQPFDRRIDLFAVGIVLWEALAGRRMWGDSAVDMSILHSLWNRSIPDLGVARPDIPPALALIVKKATEPDPDRRFQTAAEMQRALEDYVATRSGSAGSRELGKFVAELFKRDRAEIKARIDEQIKLLENAETPEAAEIGMARVYSGATPLGPSVVQMRPGAAHGTTGSTKVSRLSAEVDPPARSRTGWIASGTAAMIVLAGAWFALRAGPAAPVTEAGPRVAASQVAATAPATPAAVHVTLAATPASAHVLVDGKPIASNPFAGTFPADSASHTVRAEAPGYEPASVDVLFDRDRAVNLALRPVDPQPATPASRSPSRATSAPSAAPSPHSTRKKDDLEPF